MKNLHYQWNLKILLKVNEVWDIAIWLICQTRTTVFDHIYKHGAEYFWRTSWCLEMQSKTVLSIWYTYIFSILSKTIFPIKPKTKEENRNYLWVWKRISKHQRFQEYCFHWCEQFLCDQHKMVSTARYHANSTEWCISSYSKFLPMSDEMTMMKSNTFHAFLK